MSRKLIKSGAILLLLLFPLAQFSFGALNLSLGTITNNVGAAIPSLLDVGPGGLTGPIDAYYTNPSGNDPTSTLNRLKLATGVAQYTTDPILDPDDGFFTHYRGYVSGGGLFFVRNASDAAPGGTVFIRVWSGTPNTQGSYYSPVSSFANGALSGTIGTLATQTSFKADSPYTPLITQFEETTTTLADGSTSSNLKVYSAQPTPTDSNREVTTRAWKMWVDGQAEPTGAIANETGATLTLAANQVQAGTTYRFRVSHTNWFSVGENWGTDLSYTVAGAGGAITATTETWAFSKTNTGINTFAIPFVLDDLASKPVNHAAGPNNGQSIDLNGNGTITVGELIQAINTQITPNRVTVFGWWDAVASPQRHVGLTSISGYDSAGDPDSSTNTTGGTLAAILGTLVQSGAPYQVSVDNPSSFSLSGFRQ